MISSVSSTFWVDSVSGGKAKEDGKRKKKKEKNKEQTNK
jgi:hypothetical protein